MATKKMIAITREDEEDYHNGGDDNYNYRNYGGYKSERNALPGYGYGAYKNVMPYLNHKHSVFVMRKH
ncbi:20061_t:CDS:2 [Gigaspora rosea]|nr:20061_t:CDS:2 [Gigaspora rosea]